jgi:hypothetical protein
MIEHSDLKKQIIVRPRIVKSFPVLGGFIVGGAFTINGVTVESFRYPVTEAPEEGKVVRAVVSIDFVEDKPISDELIGLDNAKKAGLLPADLKLPATLEEKVRLKLMMTKEEVDEAMVANLMPATLEDKVRLKITLTEEEIKEATEKGLINP